MAEPDSETDETLCMPYTEYSIPGQYALWNRWSDLQVHEKLRLPAIRARLRFPLRRLGSAHKCKDAVTGKRIAGIQYLLLMTPGSFLLRTCTQEAHLFAEQAFPLQPAAANLRRQTREFALRLAESLD